MTRRPGAVLLRLCDACLPRWSMTMLLRLRLTRAVLLVLPLYVETTDGLRFARVLDAAVSSGREDQRRAELVVRVACHCMLASHAAAGAWTHEATRIIEWAEWNRRLRDHVCLPPVADA